MGNRRRRFQRGGFTLVELTIVVLVVGILAAVSGPRFATSLKKAQLDGACQRIKSDLSLARATAVNGSTTQTVQFTNGSATYTLPGITHPDHPSQTYSVNLAETAYQARVTTAVFGASTNVQFDRYGQPTSGGVVTVTVGGLTKTVTVDATSGLASVQ